MPTISTSHHKARKEVSEETSSGWSLGAPPLVQVAPCSLPRPQAGQENELHQVLLDRLLAVEGAIASEACKQEVPSPSRFSNSTTTSDLSPRRSSRFMAKLHEGVENSPVNLEETAQSFQWPFLKASEETAHSSSGTCDALATGSPSPVTHVEPQKVSSPGRSETDSDSAAPHPLDFEYDLLFDVMNKMPRSDVDRLSSLLGQLENEKRKLRDEVGSLQKKLHPDLKVAPTDVGLSVLHSVMSHGVPQATPAATSPRPSGPLAAASLRLPLGTCWSSLQSDSSSAHQANDTGVVPSHRVLTPRCNSRPQTPRGASRDAMNGQSCRPQTPRGGSRNVKDSPSPRLPSTPRTRAVPLLSVAQSSSEQRHPHSWAPSSARSMTPTLATRAVPNHAQHLSVQTAVAVAHVIDSPRTCSSFSYTPPRPSSVIRQSSLGMQPVIRQSSIPRQISAERWVASPRIAIQTASPQSPVLQQSAVDGKAAVIRQSSVGRQTPRFPDVIEYPSLVSPRHGGYISLPNNAGPSSVSRQSSIERPAVVRPSSVGRHRSPAHTFGTQPDVVTWVSSTASPNVCGRQSSAARPSLRGRLAPTCYPSLKGRSTLGIH